MTMTLAQETCSEKLAQVSEQCVISIKSAARNHEKRAFNGPVQATS